jgi:hypothetical protein
LIQENLRENAEGFAASVLKRKTLLGSKYFEEKFFSRDK